MLNTLLYRGPTLADLHEGHAKHGRIDAQAPVRASHEVLIEASPAAVWGLLSDPRTWPRIDPDVRDIQLGSPVGVDTEFRWRRGSARMRSRFAVLTPDREVTWTGTSAGARAIHRHVLEPHEVGTRLVSEESIAGALLALYFPVDKLEASLASWLGHVRNAASGARR